MILLSPPAWANTVRARKAVVKAVQPDGKIDSYDRRVIAGTYPAGIAGSKSNMQPPAIVHITIGIML